MANDASIRSLARAFDRAWDSYYRSARLTVSQDIARTELARRLVQLSKEGVRDEGSQSVTDWPRVASHRWPDAACLRVSVRSFSAERRRRHSSTISITG